MPDLTIASDTVEFRQPGDFTACRAAEKFLNDRGFSFGPVDSTFTTRRGIKTGERGIKFGRCKIAKFRNLDVSDCISLDGVMRGDMRNGPVTIELYFCGWDSAQYRAWVRPDTIPALDQAAGVLTIVLVIAAAVIFGATDAHAATLGSDPATITNLAINLATLALTAAMAVAGALSWTREFRRGPPPRDEGRAV